MLKDKSLNGWDGEGEGGCFLQGMPGLRGAAEEHFARGFQTHNTQYFISCEMRAVQATC